MFQKFHILSKAIHWKEAKEAKKPDYFPKQLPNALAILGLKQFKKLERFNNHRQRIADFYFEKLSKDTCFELPLKHNGQICLRFTIKHPKARQIIKKFWKKNILIGDWYDKVISPWDTNLEKLKYKNNSCLKAEKLAQTTLNLPTHINISQKQAQKIVNFLKLC